MDASSWGQATGQVQVNKEKHSREAQLQKSMGTRLVNIVGIVKNSSEAKVGEVSRRINIMPSSLGDRSRLLPSSGSSISNRGLYSQHSRKREPRRVGCPHLNALVPKWHMLLPFTAHWSELVTRPQPGCKEGWEVRRSTRLSSEPRVPLPHWASQETGRQRHRGIARLWSGITGFKPELFYSSAVWPWESSSLWALLSSTAKWELRKSPCLMRLLGRLIR